MADSYASVVFELLDNGQWVQLRQEDLGNLLAGSTSSELDIRVRNLGVERSGVELYLSSEEGSSALQDLQQLYDWGDGGEGLQVQQKNGAGPADWGAWTSFSNSNETMTLSKFGVDPVQGEDGLLPKAKACRFRVRASIPADADGRARRYAPRLGVRYISG